MAASESRARGRSALVTALVVLSVVALLGSLLAGYVERAVFNSDQFANRATAALESDSVRALIAERITDDVVLEKEPGLLGARPAIQGAAEAIVGGGAFTKLFRAAVRDVHASVLDRDADTVTLVLADVGTLLSEALRKVAPRLAARMPDERETELVRRDIGTLTADVARAAESLRRLWLFLLVAGIALAGAAIWLSPSRRQTVARLGAGLAAAGILLLIAYAVLRSVLVAQVDGPEAQAAAREVWDAFLADLRAAGWILAGGGAVVAAAAASLIQPVGVERPIRRAWNALTTEPIGGPARLLRAAVLVAIGALVLAEPDAVLHAALTAAGVYLIYKGVEAVLRVTAQRGEQVAAARAAARSRSLASLRLVTVGALAALIIAGAVALFAGIGGTGEAAPPISACNGHEQLCGKRLNEVALPATHNSMSAPLPGWFGALQEAPIQDQLDDGVRGLLIDTHYGVELENGRVRTDLEDEASYERQKYVDGLGPDAVDAALRLRKRLGFSGEGERGAFLCHSFCELGFTPLAPVLEDIRDFLVANPNEVLVLVNQDAIAADELVRLFEEADLARFAYDGPTEPWPTLREMIRDDKRLVVLAENRAGSAPWYRLAYDGIVQETPFSFTRPAALTDPDRLPKSCRPNRGPPTAPLFLINHWVNSDPLPQKSHARRVNAYEPLLRRARECARERDLMPTLVAVDFYREGDLFRVVDTLNGVPAVPDR
jgi:hypothetical protein